METLIKNRLSFDGLERYEDNLRNELLRIIYFYTDARALFG